MTLIVALRCVDGVVVGADSLATRGAMGNSTVQETTQKISVVRGSRILAVTGPVGLAQRYNEALDGIADQVFKSSAMSVATQISAEFWKHANLEYQRSSVVAQATGSRAPLAHASHSSIVAANCAGGDRLFQFSETCAPEEATDGLPYVTMGSGQTNADPFMAFMRRVFFPSGVLPVVDGVFVVNWALLQGSMATPGIGGAPQIAILQKGKARILDPAELVEHSAAVEDAERALVEWRAQLSPDTKSKGTPPPAPPTA